MRLMIAARIPLSCRAAAFAVSLALPAVVSAQEDERARRVYEIFKTSCLECHGESRKGNLDLRTHATLIKGGASGRVVVPHEPLKSKLFLLVSHADPDDVMPLKRPKLSDDDVEAIRQWIEDGASLEAVEDAVPDEKKAPAALAKLEERPIRPEERQYWAFQKPRRPPVPLMAPMPSHQRVQAGNPIDAFLRAAMKQKGLTPSPRANRRTLIRRAYLDVLGLPPSPREVDAFVADRSPRCLAETCQQAPRFATLRRTLGAALARPRPVCGFRRLRIRRGSAGSLALPRLRRQLVQQRQAVFAVRPRADCR